MWTLFLLPVIYCWKNQRELLLWDRTTEGHLLNSCMHKSFRSKWIYQAIVCVTFRLRLPPSHTRQLSCRATGLIHHLCNRGHARGEKLHREYSSLPSVGDKQAQPRHTSLTGKQTRGREITTCLSNQGAWVWPLCAVSGIVNHRGTQAPQLLPREGGGGGGRLTGRGWGHIHSAGGY